MFSPTFGKLLLSNIAAVSLELKTTEPNPFVVGEVGLEPTLLSEHGPKPCAYTSSATRPLNSYLLVQICGNTTDFTLFFQYEARVLGRIDGKAGAQYFCSRLQFGLQFTS